MIQRRCRQCLHSNFGILSQLHDTGSLQGATDKQIFTRLVLGYRVTASLKEVIVIFSFFVY